MIVFTNIFMDVQFNVALVQHRDRAVVLVLPALPRAFAVPAAGIFTE